MLGHNACCIPSIIIDHCYYLGRYVCLPDYRNGNTWPVRVFRVPVSIGRHYYSALSDMGKPASVALRACGQDKVFPFYR